jgi:hypothetical protein
MFKCLELVNLLLYTTEGAWPILRLLNRKILLDYPDGANIFTTALMRGRQEDQCRRRNNKRCDWRDETVSQRMLLPEECFCLESLEASRPTRTLISSSQDSFQTSDLQRCKEKLVVFKPLFVVASYSSKRWLVLVGQSFLKVNTLVFSFLLCHQIVLVTLGTSSNSPCILDFLEIKWVGGEIKAELENWWNIIWIWHVYVFWQC